MSESLDNDITDLRAVGPVTLRISSPAELIAAIPYLVGFHPAESLVLVGLSGSRVTVTARLDLQDCGDDELHHSLTVLARSGADSVVAAVFSDDLGSHCWPSWSHVIEPLYDLAGWQQLRVGEAFVVRGGRFWPYDRADEDAAGIPLESEATCAAASATYAGLVARPDRATLIAVLQGEQPSVRRRHDPGLQAQELFATRATLAGTAERYRRSVKRSIFAAARAADATLPLPDSSSGREAELCRFAVGLTDVAVRDAVWLAVDQGRLDGRSLWLELLRTMPGPYDAAALFLFGWSSWRDGNGVLAVEAATRALDSDPGYSAAELLISAVQAGLDPFRTPRLRAPRL